MRNKPAYALASVDAALLLATLLQHEGAMRVTDVAVRLGVSASTAHRLLSMLVYRDFAAQLPDRSYGPGPLLATGPPTMTGPAGALRSAALPHLRSLVEEQQESANLVVLTGADVRFVATVECDAVLRVGDRTGRVLPAHRAAGGLAILAALDRAAVRAALSGLDDSEAAQVRRVLSVVRRQGFAINDQRTEVGVLAVGVVVPATTSPRCAVSLAMPRARYSRSCLAEWADAVTTCSTSVAEALAPHSTPASR